MGLWDWLRGEQDPPPADVPAAPTEADVVASLDGVATSLREAHASPLVTSRVARIDRLVRACLPRLASLGLGSADAYAVVATATSYLPEAVAGYLRLPRDWADTRPIDEGRTALMVLVDQLELLGATMTKVLDAVNRSDAQALIAHGRFLEARFHGADGGGLGLDPSGTPEGPPSSDTARRAAPGPKPSGPSGASANSLDLEP
ncbi:conserved hypothetical protein [Nostocoides japonicum T1-X7]|uniref:Uncharacterized protein n=1 Tax=Nostocoides japonicum T1-X7 TaxID=1194083 RepID=A0A077LVS3_9MICO|nr:hypothetical protein [Tetrasphaera japonica]CCH77786.1 conserved hypothetical protein [Tetrasphaera japonica T1-X7]